MNKLIISARILTAVVISASFFCMSGCSDNSSANKNTINDSAYLLDTTISVTTNADKTVLDEITDTIKRLDSSLTILYSDDTSIADYPDITVNDTNDILVKTSELNKKYGDEVNISCGELNRIWGISTDNPSVPSQKEIDKALLDMTDTGYFDCDIKSFDKNVSVDIGSVAKGYGCDRIKNQLDKLYSGKGSVNKNYAIVDMASSTLLYGRKPDDTDFNVAVRNPDGGEYLGVVRISQCFISSSGGYERYFESNGVKYSHILDTLTGYPADTDLTSVTVIIPADTENGGIMSDFLSTLIYIRGTKGLSDFLSDNSFFVIAADSNHNIWLSENTNVDFTVNEESGYKIG